MNSSVKFKLSLMMFLEFFAWGAWYVTLGTFLGHNLDATGAQLAAAFSTQSFGAIIAPFIIGLIADKYFNAEKILGILHLIGAVLMYAMFQSDDFSTFYPYVFAYMVIFMPTLALVNSVSFEQMKDPSKEFSGVRVWGTLGWIAAGLLISFVFQWESAEALADGLMRNTILLTSVSSLVLGMVSFMLPATSPKAVKGQAQSLSAILICISLAFYYQNANPFLSGIGMANATGMMTIGQVSEALFLLLLPFFFKKYGFKTTILVGMIAWVVRYALFAFGDAGSGVYMLIIGIALHGVCYDFFFVSGQIYTDAKAGPQYKNAAQGLITLATYGIGMLIGFWVAGLVSDLYLVDGVHDWRSIWMIPSAIALLVSVLFLFTFRE